MDPMDATSPPSSSPPLCRSRSRLQSSSRSRRSWSPPSSSFAAEGRAYRFRSSSPVASSSQQHRAAEKSPAASAASAASDVVYMFVSLLGGPIRHCLFSLSIPDLTVPPPSLLQPCDRGGVRESPLTISPILEFREDQFRPGIDCVKLGSKLYFLGGYYRNEECPVRSLSLCYSPDVYFVDTATLSNTSSNASELLASGASMISGKAGAKYFVQDHKIYATGTPYYTYGVDIELETLFEVFNPSSNQWSPLRAPPFSSRIVSLAVVKRKVVFATMSNSIFFFDLDDCAWEEFDKYLISPDFVPTFRGRCWFLENTQYSIFGGGVISYGPGSEDDFPGLFKFKGYASSVVSDAIDRNCPSRDHSFYLHHLGGRKFCFAMTGAFCRDTLSSNRQGDIRIVFFELCEDGGFNGKPSTDENGVKVPPFGARLLGVDHYVWKSKHGGMVCSPHMRGCC